MAAKIKKPREIIDRQAIIDALDLAARTVGTAQKRRARALEILKAAFKDGHDEVRIRFDIHGLGTEAVRENCFLVDQLVRIIHDFAIQHEAGGVSLGPVMSVVAVGGFGRGELSPQSDVDLLFLLAPRHPPEAEQVVEYILYMLWDLGLKVGHATRSVSECIRLAKQDLTICTALLEARWVWGDQALFAELRRRYRAEVVAGTQEKFVESKLAERDARHARLGEARYVLEPNIKEGKGGLRDLHTLYWIAKYLFDTGDVRELVAKGSLSQDAANRFIKAQQFLWTVRCHLHYLTGREEDRLTFDMQEEIGWRMGYTNHGGSLGVERFIKHYFLIAKDVGDLTRIFCALLESQNRRAPRLRFPIFQRQRKLDGFTLEGNRLDVESEDAFAEDPVKMIRLFHTALTHDVDIHPHALSLVTQNLKRIDNKVRTDAEANRLFVELLTSRKDPEAALRHMNEAGVLGRFIPDFGRVVAQMQYDMYHVYTVDEHTIQAIGLLNRLEAGKLTEELPIASALLGPDARSRRTLFVATFLHDIAKGRNGDHSELGAEVALKLGPRLGLSAEETDTVSWLVRYHLLMTRTAFKRDIEDAQTIADFVSVVQSPERLNLLLLLTVADVRAVGPGVWNGWKAGLLRDLYQRALEVMSGGQSAERRESRVLEARKALTERLADSWSEAEIEAHLARGYPSYWVSFDTETLLRHARQIKQAEDEKQLLSVEAHDDPAQGIAEIVIYTGDHHGLFSQIAGAMALSGVSIIGAKIHTLVNGMALDSFAIRDAEGGPFEIQHRMERLKHNLEEALSGRLPLPREIAKRREQAPSRARLFNVVPRVLVNNALSSTYTVIEINGRNRLGLLYDLTSAMSRLSLSIASAHVSTYGERVVDVFYVKDVFGLKIEHERKIDEIRETLLGVLGGEPAGERPARRRPARAAQ